MKTLGFCAFLISMAVFGPAFPASDDPAGVNEDSCAVLENGLVPELFGVDGSLVSYRRSIPVKRAGHVLCNASWDNPDKAELEAAYASKLQEWSRNMATGKKEPMPKAPNALAQVSVTLVATRFDSAAAAVASLEEAVAYLGKGVTVTVADKEYEKKTGFGQWLENLGDRAIFSDQGELLVASKGRRFSVTVSVSTDPATDRERALALARRIIESL